MLHYLDDFFAILAPTDDTIAYGQQFDLVYKELGFKINHIKDIIDIIADFLRIEFDSILM